MWEYQNGSSAVRTAEYDGGNDPTQCFRAATTMASIRSIWARQAAHKNLKFKTYVEYGFPESLPLDSLKLQYCLNNLVSNAIKYTKSGFVYITSNHFISTRGKHFIVLSVQDSGPGIPEETIAKIFTRPLRPDLDASGYGVIDTGLPVTREIMQDLGGRVLVNSVPGKGSTFSLILPIDDETLLRGLSSSAYSSYNAHALQNLNLLVVDDYNLNQLTIKTLIQDQVSKIFIAANGFEALEVLNSCHIDVILMDIHMPELDGIETTMRIRESKEKWSHVKIIALSADPQYQHMDLCRKIGMNGTLSKPIKRHDVLSELHKLFSKRSFKKTG